MSNYLYFEAKLYIYQCRGFQPYPDTMRKLAHMNIIERWKRRLHRLVRLTTDFHKCVAYQDLFNRLPCYLTREQTYHLIAAKRYVDNFRLKQGHKHINKELQGVL